MATAHVAVLAWLGRRTPQAQFADLDPPAAVEVWVVPQQSPSRATGPRGGFSRPALHPRIALPAPPSSVIDTPPPPPPTPEAPPPPVGAEARMTLRDSLRRGVLGCANRETTHLTSEERAACDTRLATTAPPAAPPLNLDVRGDFARDEIPYLQRRPKNGCKLMAGGAKSPSGQQGAAAGVGCAKSF